MQKCEKSVVSDLRAGFTVPSLAQCVEELMLNSIDAHAKTVTVRINVERGFIQIADDGDGILPVSFDYLAEAYSSSKCGSLEDLCEVKTFGFRGEALMAIRTLAESLEIKSKHFTSGYTAVKVFKRGVSLPVRRVTDLSNQGTVVTVKNLFHCLPVRQTSLLSPGNVSHVCHVAKSIALIHSHVSIILRDDCSDILVSSVRMPSMIGMFGCLFDREKARKLRAVSAINGVYSVSGCVCRDGHVNRSLQFVFVNSRLVQETRIHQLLELMFQQSIITQRCVGGIEVGVRALHAVYVLNLMCPAEMCDVTLEPAKRLVEFKDWQSVLSLFVEIVRSFLTREGLHRGYKVPSARLQRDTKYPAVGPSDRPSSACRPGKATSDLIASAVVSHRVTRKGCAGVADKPTAVCLSCQQSGNDRMLNRAAANCTSSFGSCAPRNCSKISQQLTASAALVESDSLATPVKKLRSYSMCCSTMSSRLAACSNACSVQKGMQSRDELSSSVSTGLTNIGETMRLSALSSHPTGLFRFSKDMLTNAKVVGQVDNKFIACLVNPESKGEKSTDLSLVLIDQHAAHERVRLEEFEDGLVVDGDLRSKAVDPPVRIRIPDCVSCVPPHKLQDKLERWGVTGRVSCRAGLIEMVVVRAPIILMKNDSSEVSSIETLKDVITEVISSGRWSSPGSGWPLSLADVLHSKACHGAIRFGEQLTALGCRQLIRQLAKCRLAFQCAHGRPTVQPLGNIGSLSEESRQETSSGEF